MASSPVIQRHIPDLLEALQRHLRLLKDFYTKAFEEGNKDYLGEVAGKLRVLVCEPSRKNRPLLIGLMEEFQVEIKIPLDSPRRRRAGGGPEQVTLKDFLKLTAYGTQTKSRGYVQLSKEKMILFWAQQIGSAHEAWYINEAFKQMHDIRIQVGPFQISEFELRNTARIVIRAAELFLDTITSPQIDLKTAERVLKYQPNNHEARFARAVALSKFGHIEEAVQECKKVIKADPRHTNARIHYGYILQNQGEYSQAIQLYEEILVIDNNNPYALYNLACVYSLQQEFEKCIEHLRRIDPKDAKEQPVLSRWSESELSITVALKALPSRHEVVSAFWGWEIVSSVHAGAS